MENPKRGFIPIVLLIAVVMIVGVGIYYYSQREVPPKSESSTNTDAGIVNASTKTMIATSTEGWKTYSNKKYGFEFKYPANWGTGIEEIYPTDFYQKNASGEITGRKTLQEISVRFSTRVNENGIGIDPQGLNCAGAFQCGASLQLIQYDPNYPLYQAGSYEEGPDTSDHNIMTDPVAGNIDPTSGVTSVNKAANTTVAGFPALVEDYYFVPAGTLGRRHTFITPSYEIVVASSFSVGDLALDREEQTISLDKILAASKDSVSKTSLQKLLSEVYTMTLTFKLDN